MISTWLRWNWDVGRFGASATGAWLGITLGVVVGAAAALAMQQTFFRGQYFGTGSHVIKRALLCGAGWGGRMGFVLGGLAGLLAGRVYPVRIGVSITALCLTLAAMPIAGMVLGFSPSWATPIVLVALLGFVVFAAGYGS